MGRPWGFESIRRRETGTLWCSDVDVYMVEDLPANIIGNACAGASGPCDECCKVKYAKVIENYRVRSKLRIYKVSPSKTRRTVS